MLQLERQIGRLYDMSVVRKKSTQENVRSSVKRLLDDRDERAMAQAAVIVANTHG